MDTWFCKSKPDPWLLSFIFSFLFIPIIKNFPTKEVQYLSFAMSYGYDDVDEILIYRILICKKYKINNCDNKNMCDTCLVYIVVPTKIIWTIHLLTSVNTFLFFISTRSSRRFRKKLIVYWCYPIFSLFQFIRLREWEV